MALSKNIFLPCLCLAFLLAGPGYGQGKKKKEKKQQDTQLLQAMQEAESQEKGASEAFFIEGMKFMMVEDYPKALEHFQKSYSLSPKNATLNYKLAETIMLLGRPKEAVSFAQTAVNLDGANPYFYLLLAQLYSGQQQYEEATKTLTKLTKDVPNTEQYLFNLADLYLTQNKYEDALKTYDRIEKQYGFIEEIAFKKQQIYLRQNNLDKALEEGENLITSDPSEIRYTLAQAEMLANNKKLDEAIQLIQKALLVDQNNANARVMLADLYRQKGNLADSEKNLKLAFALPGLDLDTKVKIIRQYLRQLPVPPQAPDPQQSATALELADLTLKSHPREAKAYEIAGQVQALAKKNLEARKNFLKALSLDNSSFETWQKVVFIDAELMQMDSLVVHTEKALELFPNQAMLWFYNGSGHLFQKNAAKGVRSLEYGKKLAADNPELQVQFNMQLGDGYQSLKDYNKSEAAYESVLVHDPNNAHVLNNYSYYLSLRNQDLPKARAMAERLVKANPREATYLDTYAWVLYKMKDYVNARKYLEEAVALKKDADILEHYGDTLFRLGEKELALEQWQKAKQTGKASALIDKKIKDKTIYE